MLDDLTVRFPLAYESSPVYASMQKSSKGKLKLKHQRYYGFRANNIENFLGGIRYNLTVHPVNKNMQPHPLHNCMSPPIEQQACTPPLAPNNLLSRTHPGLTKPSNSKKRKSYTSRMSPIMYSSCSIRHGGYVPSHLHTPLQPPNLQLQALRPSRRQKLSLEKKLPSHAHSPPPSHAPHTGRSQILSLIYEAPAKTSRT